MQGTHIWSMVRELRSQLRTWLPRGNYACQPNKDSAAKRKASKQKPVLQVCESVQCVMYVCAVCACAEQGVNSFLSAPSWIRKRDSTALSLEPCDLKDRMPLSVLQGQKAQASDRPGHTLHSLWGQLPSCATHLSFGRSVMSDCNPMDCSTPGSSVLHCLLALAQIHVHWVSEGVHCSILAGRTPWTVWKDSICRGSQML